MMTKMMTKPLPFSDPGRFALYLFDSIRLPIIPERGPDSIQICVPLARAHYSIAHKSDRGAKLVKHLGGRDILVLPADDFHAVTWQRPSDVIAVHVSERFLAEALGLARLHLPSPFTVRDAFISAAAVQLRTSLRDGRPPSAAFAEAIATVIAYRVGIEAQSSAGLRASAGVQAFSAEQIGRLNRFIERNLDRSFTTAMLASEMKLTQWHFARRFHASHGISPLVFITERRLMRAQELLRGSNQPITQIALDVGMTHSHFSRSFLKRFGVSPREFRQQVQS
jgi:AraC family transcriptional regulator